MSEKHDKDNSETDELTAEIRRNRPFDLSEAIGRAGAGNLKGASPVPASRQLLWQIEQLLTARLNDSEGSLTRTILSRLADNPALLAKHRDNPGGALSAFLTGVLAASANLAELVRQADVRWGRDYDERPHFERDGQTPHPGDPYTISEVQTRLTRLLQTLRR